MDPLVLDEIPCDGDGCGRAARDGGGRRRATESRRLCKACWGGLVAGIRELPRLYGECGEALASGAAGGLREKTTGGQSSGLVLNSFAAEARTDILTILGSWSGLVAQQRRLPAPVRQVVLLSDFLLTNLAWLASHPAVGELSAEVGRTTRRARRAAYPGTVKRIVIGPCVMPECGGELAATVRAGLTDAAAQVRCGADPGHAWDGHEWIRLRRQMRPSASAEERWLAAADIARLWSAPTGTVYRLASEQGWRRITRAGRTYYAEKDVHGSFSRRRERALQKG